MGEEKRQKLLLVQDLENIKDKFAELLNVMKKLDHFDNIEAASQILNDEV